MVLQMFAGVAPVGEGPHLQLCSHPAILDRLLRVTVGYDLTTNDSHIF